MQDRVSLYPGRVKLVPVAGQENTYDMVRADSPTQEGTPLNKDSLLKDATAALLGGDASMVPDEALQVLKTLVDNAQNSADVKAKIETVFYTGTGVGGSEANATILEVPEFAKIVVIVGLTNNTFITYGAGIFVKPNAVPSAFGQGGGFGGNYEIVSYSTKWVNTTLSWYAKDANSVISQLNVANFKYVAYCIG